MLIFSDQQQAAHNQGQPNDDSPWMEGDPRNIFNRGVAIEMSVFLHAEAGLIAQAARLGQSLQGSTLYVTTFPCPACAKLIAHSGIKRLYFTSGYAVLDGRRIMEEYGVQLVRITGIKESGQENSAVWVPYTMK